MRGHALVTGALGGLGTDIVKTLLEQGYDVVACDRRGDDAEPWLASFSEAERARIAYHTFDVRDLEAVEGLRRHLEMDGTHIAYLVNNAGMTAAAPPWEMEPRVFDRVLQVNLYGTYNLTRTFCNPMREAGFGRIVNFASLFAYAPGPGQAPYAAAKAGIVGYTHSLALDLADSGVTVNTIAPGLIWHERLAPTITESEREGWNKRTPMKRPGEPREIAETVAFLLSAGAGYITGQTIHVNGGSYLT